MLLEGKEAVVTGARCGIGLAVVEEFAKQGANVWACARKSDGAFEEAVARLVLEHGVEVRPLYFDLRDGEAMKDAVSTIFATKHYPSILVNNAGVMHAALFQMTPISTIREVFEDNLFGHMALTQHLLRGMSRNGGGSIINVASIEALESVEGNCAYGTSKAALIAWTKTLAVELARLNIRVNAVAPGLVRTSISERQNDNARDRHIEACAFKRLGDPEEIAALVSFIASDKASFINGSTMRIDGGWVSY